MLTRTSFNTGKVEGGFNRRNKYKRDSGNIVNQDTLRKYFKDTNACQLTSWNNTDVAKFFSKKQAILKEGIFLLDSSIIPLPDDKAECLPLDKHKNYVDVKSLSENEKKSSNIPYATRW